MLVAIENRRDTALVTSFSPAWVAFLAPSINWERPFSVPPLISVASEIGAVKRGGQPREADSVGAERTGANAEPKTKKQLLKHTH